MQPRPSAGTVRLPNVRVCMPSPCPPGSRANRAPGDSGLPGGNRRGRRSFWQGDSVPHRRTPRSPMSLSRRALGVGSLAAIVAGALLPLPAQAAPNASLAPVQDYLAGRLADLDPAEPATVLVHGTDIAAARAAVDATGMRPVTEF